MTARALLPLLLLAGCAAPAAWTLEQPPEPLLEARRGTVVTDEELKATGEWTPTDAAARRLVGPRGQVRRAPAARTWTDVWRVGRTEVVVPSPSAAASRALGLTYEPRYHYDRRSRTWIMLRRDGPAVLVPDEVDGRPRLGDDAPGEALLELRRRLRADAEWLEELERRRGAGVQP